MASKIPIAELVFAEDFAAQPEGERLLGKAERQGLDCTTLERPLFDTLSELETPEGVLAVATRSSPREWPGDGVVAVTLGLQDPGNLGAIARICEATGAQALIVCGGADPFAPKALRGSMGSLLRVQVFECNDAEQALKRLRQRGFRLLALTPRGGTDYRQAELSEPLALLLGGESEGFDERLLPLCEHKLSIPMEPPVESLNVAVAAGLVLYRALKS